MTQLFTNNAVALLATSISETDLTLSVQAGLGDLFPQPIAPSDYFLVTLESIYAPLTREIVKVVGRNGDVFTLSERGVEGSAVGSWHVNDILVDHRLTAETLRRFAATSETRLFDVPFTLTNGSGTTLLTLTDSYAAGTVQLYVGGLRQKNTVDYIEKTPTQIELQYTLTDQDIAEGQHVIIDCVAS